MSFYREVILSDNNNNRLEKFRVLQGLLSHITQEDCFGEYPRLIGRLEEAEREVELQILRLDKCPSNGPSR